MAEDKNNGNVAENSSSSSSSSPISAVPGEKKVKEEIQVVVFKIAGEEYAAPILEVREIIKMPDVTPVPNAPKFVDGIINLRGKVIIVIDLVKKFNLQREVDPTHIVVAEVDGSLFGVVVDEVVEVLRTDKENIKPTPKLMQAKIKTKYLESVIVLGQRIVIILEIPELLSDDEVHGLEELAENVGEIPKDVAVQKQEQKQKQQQSSEQNDYSGEKLDISKARKEAEIEKAHLEANLEKDQIEAKEELAHVEAIAENKKRGKKGRKTKK